MKHNDIITFSDKYLETTNKVDELQKQCINMDEGWRRDNKLEELAEQQESMERFRRLLTTHGNLDYVECLKGNDVVIMKDNEQ